MPLSFTYITSLAVLRCAVFVLFSLAIFTFHTVDELKAYVHVLQLIAACLLGFLLHPLLVFGDKMDCHGFSFMAAPPKRSNSLPNIENELAYRLLTFTLKLGDMAVTAIIDTGSNSSIMSQSCADRLGFFIQRTAGQIDDSIKRTIKGVHGTKPTTMGRIKKAVFSTPNGKATELELDVLETVAKFDIILGLDYLCKIDAHIVFPDLKFWSRETDEWICFMRIKKDGTIYTPRAKNNCGVLFASSLLDVEEAQKEANSIPFDFGTEDNNKITASAPPMLQQQKQPEAFAPHPSSLDIGISVSKMISRMTQFLSLAPFFQSAEFYAPEASSPGIIDQFYSSPILVPFEFLVDGTNREKLFIAFNANAFTDFRNVDAWIGVTLKMGYPIILQRFGAVSAFINGGRKVLWCLGTELRGGVGFILSLPDGLGIRADICAANETPSISFSQKMLKAVLGDGAGDSGKKNEIVLGIDAMRKGEFKLNYADGVTVNEGGKIEGKVKWAKFLTEEEIQREMADTM
ncbi:hypothetical protein niasHT_024882 [Heterodera trifolii]|uniref:Aspartic peptidase DDI1-type domain-containing protein n=1 Tax=Heterodera trifolii TaxID=157864 RepID=A0ABD2JYI2_9BILA